MVLETGFPIMGVVRLQWGESELVIQGPLCADLIYQLSPVKCPLCLQREGGWRWVRSGLPWGDGNLSEFSEVLVDVGDKLWHS